MSCFDGNHVAAVMGNQSTLFPTNQNPGLKSERVSGAELLMIRIDFLNKTIRSSLNDSSRSLPSVHQRAITKLLWTLSSAAHFLALRRTIWKDVRMRWSLHYVLCPAAPAEKCEPDRVSGSDRFGLRFGNRISSPRARA